MIARDPWYDPHRSPHNLISYGLVIVGLAVVSYTLYRLTTA